MDMFYNMIVLFIFIISSSIWSSFEKNKDLYPLLCCPKSASFIYNNATRMVLFSAFFLFKKVKIMKINKY